MKKTVIIAMVLFLLVPLVYAGSSESWVNIEFGGNYSTNAADYIFYDRFNRSDSITIGIANTGHLWTETEPGGGYGGQVLNITDKQLEGIQDVSSGPIKACFDVNLSTIGNYTIDWIARMGMEVGTPLVELRLFDAALGGGNLRIRWGVISTDSYFRVYDATAQTLVPNTDGQAKSNTTFLIRTFVNPPTDYINITIFNLTVNNLGVTQTKYITELQMTSDQDITIIKSICYNMDANDARINTTELAIYNGTGRPILISTTSVVVHYPYDGNILDNITYPFYINGTATTDGGTIQSTWINNSNFKNKKTNTNFNFSINGTIEEGTYSLMIISNNSNGVIGSKIIEIGYDISLPNISSNLINNNTPYYIYDNITYKINFSDATKIFKFNITILNISFFYNITGLNTPLYIYNGSNNMTNVSIIGEYNITAEVCDRHNASTYLHCNKKTWKFYLFNYTAIYTPSIVETLTDTFLLVINFANKTYGGNGTMHHSGNLYSTINTSSSKQLNLTSNINIPSTSGNESNVNFFWDFNLNNYPFFTTNFTQFIERIRLTKCDSALTNVSTLNITILNEESIGEHLLSGIDSIFQVWTNDSSNYLNFTFVLRGASNYSICLFPNTSIYVDSQMWHNSSDGYRMRWFLENAKLTSNTSLLYLYNFKHQSQSELRGILRDRSFEPFANIITSLQRFYSDENVWRTIQMDKSDAFGQIIFYIKESSQDYRIIFQRENTIIDKTDNLKFLCSSGICEVNFLVNDLAEEQQSYLNYKTGYDNNTQIYQLNWSDTTGLTNSIRLTVTKETGTNSITICDTTVSASSGTINCDTTGYMGLLKAQIFKSQSPEIADAIEFINKFVDKLWQVSGFNFNDAGLWATGILATFAFMGAIINAPLAIIFTIVGMIIVWIFGLLNWVSITVIGTTAAMGIIIALFIKHRG